MCLQFARRVCRFPFLACPFITEGRKPIAIANPSAHVVPTAECRLCRIVSPSLHHDSLQHKSPPRWYYLLTPESRPRRPLVSSGWESVCVDTKVYFSARNQKDLARPPWPLAFKPALIRARYCHFTPPGTTPQQH